MADPTTYLSILNLLIQGIESGTKAYADMRALAVANGVTEEQLSNADMAFLRIDLDPLASAHPTRPTFVSTVFSPAYDTWTPGVLPPDADLKAKGYSVGDEKYFVSAMDGGHYLITREVTGPTPEYNGLAATFAGLIV